MTTDGHDFVRIRLEEVLGEVKALNGQLPEPITLIPAIKNIEETIELFERLDTDDSDAQEGNR